MTKYAKIVFKNAFRNRRRSILTLLAVASCMFLIANIQALLYAMTEATISQSSKFRIITQNANSIANFIPEAHRDKISRIPGVKSIVGGYWFNGVYIDENFNHFFGQMAVDDEGFREMFDDYKFDDDGYKRWLETRNGFLACREVAEKQGWKIGDRIHLTGTIFPFNPELVLCGFMEGPDRTSIYFHRRYLEEALGRPGDVDWFWIRVDDPAAVSRITIAIDKLFENSAAATRSMTEKQFQIQFTEMMGNVSGLMRNISLAILFTILLVATNALSMSVRERSTEIAVMKAIGFPSGTILALLTGESALICSAGALLGGGGAWYLYNVRHFDCWGYAQNFAVPPGGLAIIAAATAAITVIGLAPSLFAVRRPIVDGLRRVA